MEDPTPSSVRPPDRVENTPVRPIADLTWLRPYQAEVARAVIASVMGRQGLTFSVEIARQGGKNELSAIIELWLLMLFAGRGGSLIKAAPTLKPQARNSLRRLREKAAQAGLDRWVTVKGDSVEVGRARILFLSAARSANVVGHTADWLLEIDESQDISPEKYSRDFRPMAATRNATTVHYGTAWHESSLLEHVKQTNLEAQRVDGIQRHFEFDWREVARYNADYGRYVGAERARLGADHPLFASQYRLKPLGRGGRFFTRQHLDQLRCGHGQSPHPDAGGHFMAGVDLAGEESDESGAGARRDSVVVTVAAVEWRTVGPLATSQPHLRVVRWYRWRGEPHARLFPTLVDLLGRVWRCRRISVDATGLGEPVAAFLGEALGKHRVKPVRFSTRTKSDLGYGLLSAVNAGRVKAPAGEDELAAEFWLQCERAERSFRAGQTMNFYVDPSRGHDDFLMSLALLVDAAGHQPPRTARGRGSRSNAPPEPAGSFPSPTK